MRLNWPELYFYIQESKKILGATRWLFLLFLTLQSVVAFAAEPADENFDDDAGITFNNTSVFINDGVKYTITGSAASYSHTVTNNNAFSPLGNNGADYFLHTDTNGAYFVSSLKIEAADGSAFRLSSLSFDAIADANVTLTANGGTPLTYASNGMFILRENINLAANTDFYNITSITISGSNLSVSLDDLNFEPPKILTLTSATYDASTGALAVTGTNFTATVGATNDVVANKFTFTAEGGSTYTLTDSANVEITSATSFTLTLSATDRAAVNLIANKNGTSSTGGTTYNLAGEAGFIAAELATADLTGNGITVSNTTAPTVTSATYDANTGVLAVTGTNLKSANGATNDIVANKFTLTGEGGSIYTLTDTANVEVTSGTSFTMTLSATDRAGANLILNKNGTISTDISTYNLAAAEDWNAGADAAVTIADTTGNGVTVSNVAVPTITSATYNAATGALVVTGTGLLKSNGATNDIVANKFTFTGQDGTPYSLVDTANVEITSGTAFTLTLSATDKSAVNLLLNKNGSSSVGGTTYNLAAAEDWAAGADAAVAVADLTGNGITASNVVSAPDAPTIGTAVAGDGQASVTFTAPGSNGGSAITTYTATASPDGAFGTCAGPAACIATVSGLTNGTAYTFVVTATNSVGTSVASSASNAVIPKANQTITFSNPGAQNFGTSPTLTAASSAGVGYTVSFSSSTTGVCTITSGGALTFVTAGSCTIDADQAGDSATNASTTVTQTFTVNAVVPGAPTVGTATAGNTQATVTFTAPTSTGGAPILAGGYTVTANSGGATGTGSSSPITVTGLTNGVAYTFTVTATNSTGTGAASAASNSVTPASPQTITFADPGAQNFGTSPTLTATSDSGLTPTFTSSTTGVCTISSGGLLNFVSVGTCTINADQAGDSSYLAAMTVSRSFSISAVVPGAPTAASATAGDTQASVTFSAPIFTGGAAITGYTATSNPGGFTGTSASSPLTVTGLTNGVAYTFTVTATNSVGTGAASAATSSTTPKAIQTITFADPGAQSFGTAPSLIASASSGLTVTFTSSTTGVCTITAGGALTFGSTGTCTIDANQAGDGSYLAATQVSRSFTVNAVVPGVPTIGAASAADSQASVSFTAPIFNGGSSITGYTVTSSPGGFNASGAASPITVTGLANGSPYTFSVVATNAIGSSSASVASNSVTPNGAPVISGTPTLSVNQDVSYQFTPTASDSVGDVLSFSIANKPAWATFNTTTGTLSGTPSNQDVGVTNGIIISVSDGALSASLPAFNLSVVNINDAPTISSTAIIAATQDAAYSYTFAAADIDVGDVLTFSAVTKPSWLSFNAATGLLSGTPGNADVGAHPVTLRVTDTDGLTADQSFSITVTNVNDAPTISSTAITAATQDAAYSYTFAAADTDVGDVLTFSAVTKPSWLSFNAATGVLSGTPGNADVGAHPVTLRV
ncbi:beta strand repeat-containing protein, partial [Shewanella baltica]|uniref:beta strand repeat-containing protein n=1 Tax=Shewanella baltica TaxID=62322 RepID=UPI003CFD19E5